MKQKLLFRQVWWVIMLVFIYSEVEAQEKNSKEELDDMVAYFDKARKDWNVPGMAIAIVKDDRIYLEKGFGKRDVKKGGKVDEHTIFAIASNTKAFTSASLAILVDEGRISWDDKVTDYLPWFEIYDPYVTDNMKILDLLCHRTGLKTFSGDLLW